MSLFGGKDILKDGNNDQADYDGSGQFSFHQESFYANESSYQQQQQQQQQNGFGFPGYSGHSINQLPSTQRTAIGGGTLSQTQQPLQMFRGLSSTTANMIGGIGGQGQPVTDNNLHFLSAGARSSSISSTNGQQPLSLSSQSHPMLGPRFGGGSGGSDQLSSDLSSLIGDSNINNDSSNNDFSSFGLGGGVGSGNTNSDSGLFGPAGSGAGRTPTSVGLFAPVGSNSTTGTINNIGSGLDTSSSLVGAPPGVQLPPAAVPAAIQPPQPQQQQQVQLTNREKEVKFGLQGLLSDVIKCPDKESQSLALGTDLTAFGLNLSAAENLYPSFTSPFTESMVEEKDRAYKTPACYLMNPPVMKSEHIAKFQVETLFYMFYQMPRDILQAFAAQELHRREWRYQGELKIWIKQRPPQDMVSSHPQVPFVYFDPKAWETRLFDAKNRPGLAAGILSEEDVRVKNVSSGNPAASGGMGAIGSTPGAIGATLQGGGGSVSAVQQVPPDIS